MFPLHYTYVEKPMSCIGIRKKLAADNFKYGMCKTNCFLVHCIFNILLLYLTNYKLIFCLYLLKNIIQKDFPGLGFCYFVKSNVYQKL
jgi:hypothetical protein